jgi:hypothetical protein
MPPLWPQPRLLADGQHPRSLQPGEDRHDDDGQGGQAEAQAGEPALRERVAGSAGARTSENCPWHDDRARSPQHFTLTGKHVTRWKGDDAGSGGGHAGDGGDSAPLRLARTQACRPSAASGWSSDVVADRFRR